MVFMDKLIAPVKMFACNSRVSNVNNHDAFVVVPTGKT